MSFCSCLVFLSFCLCFASCLCFICFCFGFSFCFSCEPADPGADLRETPTAEPVTPRRAASYSSCCCHLSRRRPSDGQGMGYRLLSCAPRCMPRGWRLPAAKGNVNLSPSSVMICVSRT